MCPALLDRIDAAILELHAIRAEVAALELPNIGPNGSGEATLAQLMAAVVELGARTTADGRVSEATAARLLGLEAESLGKARKEGRSPPFYRMACGGSRISYRLVDLSAWLEARREDF